MKLMMFSVFDSAVGAFLTPFFVRSRGEAIRSFQDAVNDAKHQFHSHASDYTLFVFGEFDDNNGDMSSIGVPEKVATALELLMRDVT